MHHVKYIFNFTRYIPGLKFYKLLWTLQNLYKQIVQWFETNTAVQHIKIQ